VPDSANLSPLESLDVFVLEEDDVGNVAGVPDQKKLVVEPAGTQQGEEFPRKRVNHQVPQEGDRSRGHDPNSHLLHSVIAKVDPSRRRGRRRRMVNGFHSKKRERIVVGITVTRTPEGQ